MSLTGDQVAALRNILESVHDECLESPVGNLLENHLKVVALAKLLTSGYSVMEGSNIVGEGRALLGTTIRMEPMTTGAGRFLTVGSAFTSRFGIDRVVVGLWAAV